jgi:hypothetical protein
MRIGSKIVSCGKQEVGHAGAHAATQRRMWYALCNALHSGSVDPSPIGPRC